MLPKTVLAHGEIDRKNLCGTRLREGCKEIKRKICACQTPHQPVQLKAGQAAGVAVTSLESAARYYCWLDGMQSKPIINNEYLAGWLPLLESFQLGKT